MVCFLHTMRPVLFQGNSVFIQTKCQNINLLKQNKHEHLDHNDLNYGAQPARTECTE